MGRCGEEVGEFLDALAQELARLIAKVAGIVRVVRVDVGGLLRGETWED